MEPPDSSPEILNRQRTVAVRVGPLSEFARRLASTVRVSPERFAVVLVSDRRIRELNRRYRNRSATTDVLSFPLDETGGKGFLGDVVISAETAKRQARRLGHGLNVELQLLLLHGVLHLMGYDHETDRGAMNGRERGLRRRLGLE